jgi:arabinose-5-phosphate isomerase
MDIAQRYNQLLEQLASAITLLAGNMPPDFSALVEKICCLPKGARVVLSGIGKSGYIARKIAASFASTATAAIYVHPAEASHGDLGMIGVDDLVILISNSGQTRELACIIDYCRNFHIPIAAITMAAGSHLAKFSTYLLLLPFCGELSSINAPTTSTAMTLALGDALMTCVHEAKGVGREAFKRFHPGGKLGSDLIKVSEIMHFGDKLPVVSSDTLMPEVIITITQKMLGCCAVLQENRLVGIITDGDLRRHIGSNMLHLTASQVMSMAPCVIESAAFATAALELMQASQITNLLVIDAQKLVGVVHIHDLLKLGIS